MERTLIKIVKGDNGIQVEAVGTTPELLSAISSLLARLSESAGIPIKLMGIAIMKTAEDIQSGGIRKRDVRSDMDVEKSIEEIFDEILRRGNNEN